MLNIFTKTNKRIDRTIEEFEGVKRDFNNAFVMAKNQRDELLETKQALEKANQELLDVNEILATTNRLITEMAHAAGGLICRKDKDGKYLFVNEYQCKMFLKMDPLCNASAYGKTDKELIDEYRNRTGNIHTYGDICMSTDEHCKTIGGKCLYLEFGKIDDRDVILKMVKTPIYTPDGKDDGVVVFGWDITFLCENLPTVLSNGIKNNTIEKLEKGVYWIKEKHICTLPFMV